MPATITVGIGHTPSYIPVKVHQTGIDRLDHLSKLNLQVLRCAVNAEIMTALRNKLELLKPLFRGLVESYTRTMLQC